MYRQLVVPNLSVKARFARCLQWVQDAYRSPNAGVSATYAWNQTEYRHTDRNFPKGVYFIVWFEYWGTVDGVYDNWGHVVIGKDGTFYSSPYTDKTTHDTIASLSEVERIYDCTFVGWSEDIAGLRVIEGEVMQRQDVTDIYQVVIGRDPVESEYAWVGQPPMVLINALRNDANQARATADARIKELEKQAEGEFVETKVYIKK